MLDAESAGVLLRMVISQHERLYNSMLLYRRPCFTGAEVLVRCSVTQLRLGVDYVPSNTATPINHMIVHSE